MREPHSHPDPGTGLPRLRQALAHLARLHQGPANECHGLVLLQLLPNPALLRLTLEAETPLRQEISRRLGAALRPQDRLYSLGTWEWLALLPRLPSPAPVSLAMLKLRRALLQPPLESGGIELGAEIACGAAFSPDQGHDPQHLIQSARIAALHSGQSHDGTLLYHPDMEQGDAHQSCLARELQEALAENRLQLFLQPQVDIASGSCHHAEALLRWQRRDLAWVEPPQIIAALERAGLRHDFNRWLFQHAALYLAQLREAGIDTRISINLTAHDLLDPELPELLGQALATWRLPSTQLILEITETVAVRESAEVLEVLHRLRAMDICLSIDDFGTGYAGMSYLQHLPVQEIKVDQRFILPLAESTREQEITRAVVELAHRLGMEVVAEGVETPAVLECLRQLGCERAQGHLFSPPLPLEEFLAWQRARASEGAHAP